MREQYHYRALMGREEKHRLNDLINSIGKGVDKLLDRR
jgi:hypothetical protein